MHEDVSKSDASTRVASVAALLRATAATTPQARCEAAGFTWLAKPIPSDADAVRLIPSEVAVRLSVIPLSIKSGRLRAAMMDPFDLHSVDEAATIANMPLERVGVAPEAFGELMRQSYGVTAARMAESLAGNTGGTALTATARLVARLLVLHRCVFPSPAFAARCVTHQD